MTPPSDAAALPDDVRAVAQRLHDAPAVAALAVTGAGASALAWLLAVPGASRTLLEGRVPYARSALDELLGGEPPGPVVSRDTSVALARAARERAVALGRRDHAAATAIGVACTATIATDREKRGEHRCWVATAAGGDVATYGLVLTKGARDRAGEEEVVSRLVIYALAAAADMPAALDLRLLPAERLEVGSAPA